MCSHICGDCTGLLPFLNDMPHLGGFVAFDCHE